ncbi:MAG: NADH-quinone oxidoreductase subunit J [Chloroflexi bacterium]|nr:NADH-quinone oxidoreductase subunit J [Chloroflexota bacterium]
MDLILFLILAVVAIATALGMLLSRNAVYSALFLVLNFATVAVFYVLLGAPFIAMAQITVYAGAIMVLFLFVIMLLGAEKTPGNPKWSDYILPAGLALVLVLESIYLLISRGVPSGEIVQPEASVNSVDFLRQMGMALFNEYLLPFEVTSILLLVAMVGAIVLTKQEKGGRG